MNASQMIQAVAPELHEYREAKKAIIYINDVLSGKFGKLENWEVKEFEAVKAMHTDTIRNFESR
jgi:hypothetical protein